jgi:hypothetical protein
MAKTLSAHTAERAADDTINNETNAFLHERKFRFKKYVPSDAEY